LGAGSGATSVSHTSHNYNVTSATNVIPLESGPLHFRTPKF